MKGVRTRGIVRLAATVVVTAGLTVLGLKSAGVNFSPLASEAAYQKFISAYGLLSDGYFQPVSTQKLFDGAIGGMVGALGDPFSTYMDPAMTARFRELVTSQFQGIGAVLSLEGGQMVINSVMPGSPAAKAGLTAGDVLLKINGKSTAGLSLEKAVERIRGPHGTHVTLAVMRAGRQVTVSVPRANLNQQTVYDRMLPDHIGYLLITQFSEGTATHFLHDLALLKQAGAKALIVDVRQDPGGLLQSVGRIADALLPKGASIVQVEERNGKRHVLRSTGTGIHMPIVCLIDSGSASAAEILAAALHESGRVPLIGERTYGKGTVQQTEQFSDGSSIKLTVARWLTPQGQWIHKVGIAPTIPVPSPAYFHLPPLPMFLRRPLRMNDNSVVIAVLQRMLLALGFNPGRADGYFGLETEQAVKTFQTLHRLPATGQVNGETAYAINLAILAKRQRDDPQLAAAIGYLESKLM